MTSIVSYATALFVGIGVNLQAHENGGGEAHSDEPILQKGHSLNSKPYFVENAGQVTTPDGRPVEDVAYKATKGGVTLYFQQDRVSYVYPKREYQATPEKPMKDSVLQTTGLYRMDMVLKGASADAKLKGSNQREAFSRHFTQSGKALKADHFGKLVYEEVYQGIDLVYKFEDGKLKYEFVVGKKGDADDIRLKYQGAEGLRQKPKGGLAVKHPLGKLEEAEPVAFRSKARESEIATDFTVMNSETVGFKVKAQPTKPYVIDPYLQFSTFFGGSKADKIYDVEVNQAGNTDVLVGGVSQSSAFPNATGQTSHQGGKDGILAKFSGGGALQSFTYFGSAGTGANDAITGLDVRKTQNGNYKIYATGYSQTCNLSGNASASFGPVIGSAQNIFVAKFSYDLSSSKYALIGSGEVDHSGGIEVTGNGVYFCGTAGEPGTFPKNGGCQKAGSGEDGAFGRLNFDLTKLKTSRLIGGDGPDRLYELQAISSGTFALKGWTESANGLPLQAADQPNYGGNRDHLVGVVNENCNNNQWITWLTYLGGSSRDGMSLDQYSNSLAVEQSGSLPTIHVTGATRSSNFPVTQTAYQSTYQGSEDMIYARYDLAGVRKYSTYIGASGRDVGRGIITRGPKHYMIGGSSYGGLPINGKSSFIPRPNNDGYLIEFEQDDPVYSSYYGGKQEDRILNLAYSQGRNELYAAGDTRKDQGTNDFPTTTNAHQPAYGGGPGDGFLAGFVPDPTCKTAAHPSPKKLIIDSDEEFNGSFQIHNKIVVESGHTLTLLSADVVFDKCAKLVVKQNAILDVDNSHLRSCSEDFWQGIIVKQGGQIFIGESRIEKAQVGISAQAPKKVAVKESDFDNNIHHMILKDLPERSSTSPHNITNNNFDDIICNPSNLSCNRTLPGWVDDCNMVNIGVKASAPTYSYIANIEDNVFDGNILNNKGTSKAILLHKVDGENAAGDVEFIRGNLFDDSNQGLRKTSIKVERSSDIYTVNNVHDLTSDQIGVFVENSGYGITRKSDISGSGSFGIKCVNDPNKGLPGKWETRNNEISNINTGVYYENMGESIVENNTISNFKHGVEYYSEINFVKASFIRKNKITGGTPSNPSGHGIVVAPIKDPVGASTGANNDQSTINLEIRCNKIWYNELGIVGSGYLIDQISSTQPAGNMFNDPANPSTSPSRNSDWDILWRNRFTTTKWDYYHSNAYYRPNSNMPNPNTAYDPKPLNGTSIGGSQNATQVDDSKNNGINYLGCYGTWKRNPFSTGKQEVQNQPVQVYPNPVQDEVTIQTTDIEEGQIRVMNMTGQTVLTNRIQGSPQTLNTENWETGTYMIRITSRQGNTYTKKLLKVSQ